MKDRGKPLFLARQSYRRRRLIDATRLVPLFGGAVMLVPLLWTEPGTGSLAVRGLFLFAAWAVLVAVAAVLARLLATTPEGVEPGDTRVQQEAEPRGRNVL